MLDVQSDHNMYMSKFLALISWILCDGCHGQSPSNSSFFLDCIHISLLHILLPLMLLLLVFINQIKMKINAPECVDKGESIEKESNSALDKV